MKFQPMFSSYICVTSIPNVDNVGIEEFLLNTEQSGDGRVVSNRGGFQTNDIFMTECEPIDNMIVAALHEAKGLSALIGCGELAVSNVWGNVNRKGGYNNPHVHLGALVSAVYYVAAEDGQGDIVFNRDKYDRAYLSNFARKHDTEFNTQEFKHSPKTGDLIFFPAWMEHSVMSNTTHESRISIAMNLVTSE